MASNVIHSALREGYSNRWGINYYAFENNYDILQNDVIHLKFSGYIQKRELITFCNDLCNYLNQYLNFSIDTAYTNDNNKILIVAKAVIIKIRRSRPPSARKRDAIRQERHLAAKNCESQAHDAHTFEPSVPELEERPCSDVTPNDAASTTQTARVDVIAEESFPVQRIAEEFFPVQSSSGSSVYLHSDSSAIKRLKTFNFVQDSGVILSSSRSCSSDSGTSSVLKTKKRVRRRHLVTSISIGNQTTVDTRDTSCQTTQVGEPKQKKMFINQKAVQAEVDLIKWQSPTPNILKEFVRYLRSSDSLKSKIPAFIAFLFCCGCDTDDVENVIKNLTQDVHVEVLISLLALSIKQ